ncbi:MAG: leucine-rich repeat domain-containing protein, partial [Oscillospiraceae bacterium]|nr:leucine-rich repeat domain-containing protein [Oscillospiraceae bacterium]
PPNLTYIGDGAFRYNTKLKEINIPETVSYIGAKAFANCDSLKEVYIPGTVRVMGRSVFASCDGLEKVTVGEGIETIPKLTFESCKALKNVNLPDSIIWIEKYAFYNCKNLNSLSVTGRAFSFGEKAVGFYKNKKGKEVQNKNFKLKIYEPGRLYLDSTSLNYANFHGFESVFYLDAKAHYIMYCELYSGSRIKNIKTKLKIKGVEVEKWTSSKPNVVKITPNGKLKTTGKGTTTLTAKLKDGSTYKRKLKVKM